MLKYAKVQWSQRIPHVVEPSRGRCFIWQIGVYSFIQDQRRVHEGGVETVVRGNTDTLVLVIAGNVHPNPGLPGYPCFKNVNSQCVGRLQCSPFTLALRNNQLADPISISSFAIQNTDSPTRLPLNGKHTRP